MRTSTLFIILFLQAIIFLMPALAQPILPGIWSGKLVVPGGELTLAITFFRDENDSLRASLRSIEQSPNDFPFDQVISHGRQVTLSMRSLRIELEGTIDSTDRAMVCDFRQSGLMEGLNHLFQKCKTGDGFEYGAIEETINPEALEIIAQWIEDIVKN